jgi:L-ascorbate metabolism protein UlaG (beta-lactamase superfamily)
MPMVISFSLSIKLWDFMIQWGGCQSMEIYPLGHASFKIKGKAAVVVTDPYDSSMVGLKFPKVESVDIVTVSHQHQDHNATANISGSPFVISGPGEYEVKGVTVVGTQTFHDSSAGSERGRNTVYTITMDALRLCHLGDLGHKLSDEQLAKVGDVDILFIPTGGFYTISAKTAAEVVAQLAPLVVIPMHYKRNGLSADFSALEPVENFLKEMGAEGVQPQPKLVISKDKLPETTTVVVLEN